MNDINKLLPFKYRPSRIIPASIILAKISQMANVVTDPNRPSVKIYYGLIVFVYVRLLYI